MSGAQGASCLHTSGSAASSVKPSEAGLKDLRRCRVDLVGGLDWEPLVGHALPELRWELARARWGRSSAARRGVRRRGCGSGVVLRVVAATSHDDQRERDRDDQRRQARPAPHWAASRPMEPPESLTRRPSARRRTRSARSAIHSSWVTSTSVISSSPWRLASRSMTSSPLRVSRLPVGSSASTTRGERTRARAIATRCCSPPDSWLGRWWARGPRPTARR
jgi:hypothetical protein